MNVSLAMDSDTGPRYTQDQLYVYTRYVPMWRVLDHRDVFYSDKCYVLWRVTVYRRSPVRDPVVQAYDDILTSKLGDDVKKVTIVVIYGRDSAEWELRETENMKQHIQKYFRLRHLQGMSLHLETEVIIAKGADNCSELRDWYPKAEVVDTKQWWKFGILVYDHVWRKLTETDVGSFFTSKCYIFWKTEYWSVNVPPLVDPEFASPLCDMEFEQPPSENDYRINIDEDIFENNSFMSPDLKRIVFVAALGPDAPEADRRVALDFHTETVLPYCTRYFNADNLSRADNPVVERVILESSFIDSMQKWFPGAVVFQDTDAI